MGARPTKPKNWRCSACGFTGNAAHWTWCGGAKCNGEWKPAEAAGITAWDRQQDAAKSATDHELDDARAELVAIVAVLPEGHATVAEYASRVSELESRKAAEIHPTEKLRLLLADGLKLAKRKAAADAAVSSAVVAVQKATAFLQTKTKECEGVTAEHNANTLEIAELTRPGQTAKPDVASPAPVVALRAAVDAVDPTQLALHGLTQEKLQYFFEALGQLTAALEVATPVAAVVTAAVVPGVVATVTTDPAPGVAAAPTPTAVLPRLPLQLNTAPESVRSLAPPAATDEVTASIPAGQPSQRTKRGRGDTTDGGGDNSMAAEDAEANSDSEDPDEEAKLLGQRALTSAADAITQALAVDKADPVTIAPAAAGSSG